MTITLEPSKVEVRVPTIVTREHLTSDDSLRRQVARFGFGGLVRIEQPNDVLVTTTDTDGEILAAGMLILSPHLMQHPELHKPEIHVHAGVAENVRQLKGGAEDIDWIIDDASRGAAVLTLEALTRIAHARDHWNVKEPVVGLPPNYAAESPLWLTSSPLSL